MNGENDVFDNKEELNIWTSIWINPRKTVRYAINHKPMGFALALAAVVGLDDFLNKATEKNLGDSMALPLIVLLAIIAGPLMGLISWWIGAGLMSIIGKWIGGQGTFADLKMAVAVAYIPLIIGSILWIPDILVLGNAMFTEDMDVSIGKLIWFFFSSLLSIVVAVWGFIATIKAIAEAHRFSSWRALATIIIPTILLIVPLFLLFLAF